MTKGRDSFKRFILTILKQLPTFIADYPQEDQTILMDFLNVLKFHEVDKPQNRIRFSEYSEAFIEKYYIDYARYFELPYLWFIIDYFNIANRILRAERFHADRFNRYLVKHLRDDSETQGIFRLVRDRTPLTSLKWEPLQYSCNKFSVPLTEDQLLILKTIYQLIPKAGIRNLTQQRIKSAVAKKRKKKENDKRKKRKRSQEFQKFFTLLDAQWSLHFYHPAFGLELLYFHFQLSNSIPLSKILGYSNPENFTLTSSDIYREQDFNDYLGIIPVPKNMLRPMKDFLRQCDEERQIKLYNSTLVHDIQVSKSLVLYEAGKGWRGLTSTERQEITQDLRSTNDSTPDSSSDFILSPPFTTNWSFQQDLNMATPTEIIELYCEAIPVFNFEDLLSRGQSQNFRFSESKLDILNYIFDQQSVQIDFNPFRLIRDFSLNSYWIKVPKNIQNDKLQSLLRYLPTANVVSTEKNIFLWTALTEEIVYWIAHELKWPVQAVNRLYKGKNYEKSWFDTQSLEWKTPRLLRE